MSNSDLQQAVESLRHDLAQVVASTYNLEVGQQLCDQVDLIVSLLEAAGADVTTERWNLVSHLLELALVSSDEDVSRANEIVEFVQLNADGIANETFDWSAPCREAFDRWGEYLEVLSGGLALESWGDEPVPADAPEDLPAAEEVTQLLQALGLSSKSDPEVSAARDESVREDDGPTGKPDPAPAGAVGNEEPLVNPELDLNARLDAELLEAFLDDANRCLESMDQTVLEIEDRPRDQQLAKQFCRDLHTLKGASASVGLSSLANYLHQVESTIESESDQKGSETRLDLLIGAIDAVRTQMASLVNDRQPPVDEANHSAAPVKKFSELRITDDSSIRIRANKLDRLMDMLAELVVLRNRRENRMAEFTGSLRELEHCASRLRFAEDLAQYAVLENINSRDRQYTGSSVFNEVAKDISQVANDLKRLIKPVAEDNEAISRFIRHFRQEFMEIRRLPVVGLFRRLQRSARDAAKSESKSITVNVLGTETALDQELQERLYEPMLHLVRNAVSHGIEPDRGAAGKPESGEITISAQSNSNLLIIEIRDDGAGLNYDAVRRKAFESGLIHSQQNLSRQELAQLIFHPGFSTKQTASQVSGRGIGMDIVADVVHKLHGRIEVDSIEGKGTTMRLSIPLRSGIEHVMVFRVDASLFAVPMTAISGIKKQYLGDELVTASVASALALDCQQENDLLLFNQAMMPWESASTTDDQNGFHRLGLAVTEVLGPEEVVVCPMPTIIQQHPLFSGVVQSGSGQTALLFDAECLLRACTSATTNTGSDEESSDGSHPPKTALVVDDSISARRLLVQMINDLGYQTTEVGNGQEALRRLRDERFDVIFTDLDMPELGGWDLLSEMQSGKYGTSPTVVVSSRQNTEEVADQVRRHGAAGYISKPPSDSSVLSLMKQLELVN